MTDPEFREAYGRNKNMLYRFAWRMTGSPTAAEDIVQDCFLVLLRNPSVYDCQRGTLRSFLIGVTRNLALKQLRGDRSFEELELETVPCTAVDLSGETERDRLVAAVIAALPPLQRETLILAEYEELTLAEIGCAMGADLAAVTSRLHRARENLRRMLAPLLEKKAQTKGIYGPPNDRELRELLNEWQLPGAPASLDTRVLGAQRHWWSVLLSGSIRLPVPVVIAVVAILLVMAVALMRRQSPPQESTAINLADFQPVHDLNVRIIRGHDETK